MRQILLVLLVFLLGLVLIACGPSEREPTYGRSATVIPVETTMIRSFKIADTRIDKAFYKPGEPLQLSIDIEVHAEGPSQVHLIAMVRHLADVVDTIEEIVNITDGEITVDVTYTPPSYTPRGYGIDFCFQTANGDQIACESTAFDVLDQWIQSPRYGFLSDFFPGRTDADQTMVDLTRYHINGLQFYDWMYRHDTFLTDEDPYLDPLGRQLSLSTVKDLISAAHARNIATMPYTAIYAASIPFYEAHREWALYQAHGEPYRLGEDFLIYMDPRPDSPWVDHLLSQFDQVLEQTDFDGIHLDQYGDPKEAYDAEGQRFDLAVPIAMTIDATKALVRTHRSQGAVVFNAVNNWPIETVAPSKQDVVYIEVWPPHIWFQDLHTLIVQAQKLSERKPVVLAAYIDPTYEHNARLIDAVIFASGGGHIELGERNAMLAEPYFPNYGIMEPDLSVAIRRYYDFAVRYQEVIGPMTWNATPSYYGRIEIEGVTTQPNLLKNKVWPIVRETDRFLAVSFVNLLGVKSPEWTKEVKDPPDSLGTTQVRMFKLDRRVIRIWFATPDAEDPSMQPVAFDQVKEDNLYNVSFQIPSLLYWDLVVIEWGE